MDRGIPAVGRREVAEGIQELREPPHASIREGHDGPKNEVRPLSPRASTKEQIMARKPLRIPAPGVRVRRGLRWIEQHARVAFDEVDGKRGRMHGASSSDVAAALAWFAKYGRGSHEHDGGPASSDARSNSRRRAPVEPAVSFTKVDSHQIRRLASVSGALNDTGGGVDLTDS